MRTNWLLVRHHALAAVYVPLAVLILFAVVVAITGTGRLQYITEIGLSLAGSSLVVVFAHLLVREEAAARRNVTALWLVLTGCISIPSLVAGGWRRPADWALGLVVMSGFLAAGAFIGMRWGRWFIRWRGVGYSENGARQQLPAGEHRGDTSTWHPAQTTGSEDAAR